jgi:hypothetical protein
MGGFGFLNRALGHSPCRKLILQGVIGGCFDSDQQWTEDVCISCMFSWEVGRFKRRHGRASPMKRGGAKYGSGLLILDNDLGF